MNAGNNKFRMRFREWWVAGIGAVTGLGALIGASCCVLPLVLFNLGVSAALVSNLAFFAQAKPYLIVITAVLIVVGFATAFWKGRRPNRRILGVLTAAGLLAFAAVILPYYERELLQLVNVR